MTASSEPAWPWLLCGVLGAMLACDLSRPPVEPLSSGERVRYLAEDDPGTQSPRELQRIPGLGQGRARAVAQVRWARSGSVPATWEEVPGIGPATAAKVRRWLADRGWTGSALDGGGQTAAELGVQ